MVIFKSSHPSSHTYVPDVDDATSSFAFTSGSINAAVAAAPAADLTSFSEMEFDLRGGDDVTPPAVLGISGTKLFL